MEPSGLSGLCRCLSSACALISLPALRLNLGISIHIWSGLSWHGQSLAAFPHLALTIAFHLLNPCHVLHPANGPVNPMAGLLLTKQQLSAVSSKTRDLLGPIHNRDNQEQCRKAKPCPSSSEYVYIIFCLSSFSVLLIPLDQKWRTCL